MGTPVNLAHHSYLLMVNLCSQLVITWNKTAAPLLSSSMMVKSQIGFSLPAQGLNILQHRLRRTALRERSCEAHEASADPHQIIVVIGHRAALLGGPHFTAQI